MSPIPNISGDIKPTSPFITTIQSRKYRQNQHWIPWVWWEQIEDYTRLLVDYRT